MFVQKIINSYPKDVRKKIYASGIPLDDHFVKNKLEKMLRQNLKAVPFKLEQICLKMQILNFDKIEVSPVIKVCIPFKEDSTEWFENFCTEHGSRDAFIIGENGKVSIKNMKRKDIIKQKIIYIESDLEIREPPKYYRENKGEHIHPVFNYITGKLKNALLEKLVGMDANSYADFLMKDQIICLLYTKTKDLIEEEETFQDGSTISIVQFMERYFHLTHDELEKCFQDYVDLMVSFPLQCLLFYSSGRLANWISDIHSLHYKEKRKIQMTQEEFKLYWNTLLVEFFDIIKRRFEISVFFKHMNRSSRFDMVGMCKEVCAKIIFDKHDLIKTSHEADPYANLYRNIEIPFIYKWIIKGTLDHPDSLKGQLKGGTRLTMDGKRGSEEENTNTPIIITLVKKDAKKVPYDTSSRDFDMMLAEGTGSRPLLHVYDRSNETNNFAIDPYTKEWYTMDKDKKWTKQSTKLEESVNNLAHLFVEK